MLKNILEMEGAQELSKEQQRSVNGGQKCRTISVTNDTFTDNTLSPAMPQTCTIECRPSFLGIGFGSWGEPQTIGCSNQTLT